MPTQKECGWLIPDYLKERHPLYLGPAQKLLPEILYDLKRGDVFLHDSDHGYSHIIFELSLAWGHLRPGGLALCGNIEQNTAFYDFVKGVQCPHMLVASFDSPERTWLHGVAQKPADASDDGAYPSQCA